MNLTFLTEDQIFGENQLEIFKKRGIDAEVTDFSTLINPESSRYNLFINGRLVGNYWTKSCNTKDKAVIICNSESKQAQTSVDNYKQYCRLVLPYHGDSSVCKYQNSYRCEDDVLEVEYGYYPQNMVSNEMQFVLEDAISKKMMKKTEIYYTTGECGPSPRKLFPKIHPEYEFQGKRFVRVVIPDSFQTIYGVNLSDSNFYHWGDYIWIEVKPVKWLVDEQENIMVTEKLIFAGLPYYVKYTCFPSFETSDVKHFIDNYLSRDLFQKNDLNNNLLTVSKKLDMIISQQNENNKEKITAFLENLTKELEIAIASYENEQTDLEMNAEINIKVKKK